MKPVNNVLLILNFSPVLPVYSTLEKQPALPEYSHEHLLFFYFFLWGGYVLRDIDMLLGLVSEVSQS